MSSTRGFRTGKLLTAALPAIVAGTGCYQYQTLTPASVAPGQVVHVTLSPEGAATLAPSIGTNATTINGRVLSRTGSDVTLAVTEIARSTGPEQFMQDEPITLSLASASSLTKRVFDTPRALLAGAGIVAAVVAGQVFIDQSGIFSTKGTVSGSTR